ncbi:flagellar basal body-associated FliL family protein [Azospirillum picis]|uniref:Flagellar protein FliL n=1 Tax=Azospirillum picis TaxID=488438 RepID=A0ABU0MIE8_9PROT|nr:flagellar basal body-associated FliL family protein [Azospirillum picis]MBP2299196.1 flagellar FliL protein [Azospirillum picis]MDQ0533166.1 flagellar FliL protein [Azospirillum picis]
MTATSPERSLASLDHVGRRMVLALLGLLVAFAGAGVGSALLLRPAKAHGALGPAGAGAMPAPGVYATLPTMVVTLNDGRQLRELRLRAVLEFDPATPLTAVTPQLPRIADAMTRRLLDVSPSDLQGANGSAYVKDALRFVADRTMRPLKAKQVLIQDMLLR